MKQELVVRFEVRDAVPIANTPDVTQIRVALQSKGFGALRLVGVDALGMCSESVCLSLEPDVEFLLVFARAIEFAYRLRSKPQSVYLDDGILELSASFQPPVAWSRMGYLSDAQRVELDGDRLLQLWRGFHESVLQAASL